MLGHIHSHPGLRAACGLWLDTEVIDLGGAVREGLAFIGERGGR